jgi:glycosyltransferase involved in cell wall biosynthesis
VPAKNEAGRLESLLRDISCISEINQIIIVEGGSNDNTLEVARSLSALYPDKIQIVEQSGVGKFDAVLEGSKRCKNDLILIWDADGTVPLECTRRVIKRALSENCPVMGNRLRGHIEKGAMRSINYLGNWFFALLWAPILNWRVVDLLCGTKIFPKSSFLSVSKMMKNLDPFGDFALVLAARSENFSIISEPVNYEARQYGESNIKRWRGAARLTIFTLYSYFYFILRRANYRHLS